MTDPRPLFDDPEVLCFSVPELRRYWAYLLQDCAEKHAQEHPLYALFSSVLSMLSKATSISDFGVSPAGIGGSILFSYPQCRIVDKKAVGDSEYATISAYPDFGLMHLTPKQSPNEGVKVEHVKLLIEIKRLYYDGEEGRSLWADRTNLAWALDRAISLNLRQLLLQACCTFSVYNQREVFIMLISGVYFTLFKFERPKDFEPLLQAPSTSNKKRKLGAGESSTGQPKCQAAKEVSNAQLASLIPLGYIKVVYHSAPVFDDIRTLDLRLSDAFRQTLRERLADVDFQPCSLFDLRSAQYVPIEKDLGSARESISQWYSNIRVENDLGTPNRRGLPYFESPIGKGEAPLSPGFKGRASEVGTRESLQRKSKDFTNFLRSVPRWGRDTGSDQEGPNTTRGVGGSRQEGSGGADGTEDEGEDVVVGPGRGNQERRGRHKRIE